MWKNKDDSVITIQLSTYKTLIIIALVAFTVYTWHFFVNILVILYIAFLIASLLRQISLKIYNFLKQKIPLTLIQLLTFLSFIGLFFGLIINIASQLINQTVEFVSQIITTPNLEPLINNINHYISPFVDMTTVTNWITTFTTNLVNLQTPIQGAKWAINILPFTVFILLATWYLLIDFNNFLQNLTLLLPDDRDKNLVKHLFKQLDIQVGRWAKAQILLMFIIGIASFIVLSFLHVPYALLLATLAGLLEIIPNFGPTIAAIPAILAGLIFGGPVKAISVLIGYLLIQQLENNFLVPYIMGSIAGTHPLLTILLIMFGQAVMGPVGAILSIPVFITIVTLIKSYKEFDTIHYAKPDTKTT